MGSEDKLTLRKRVENLEDVVLDLVNRVKSLEEKSSPVVREIGFTMLGKMKNPQNEEDEKDD